MNRSRKTEEVGGLTVVEEAFHLLRGAPVTLLAPYYIGSLPFILGLLYFWADMRHSAFAERYVAQAALGLSVLFVWMKCWQAAYGGRLRAVLEGQPFEAWTWRRAARTAAIQTILQPTGVIVLPASLVLILPFSWCYAWYQNLCVFGDGRDEDGIWEASRRAWDQAVLWPRQNHVVIWLLSPFLVMLGAALLLVMAPIVRATSPELTQVLFYIWLGMFCLLIIPLAPLGIIVTLNMAFCMLAIPYALKMFLGIETTITRGGDPFNSTFLAICCGLTYLALDPVLKAAYALRCFYGESRRTGLDLRVALRAIRTRGAALAALISLALLGSLLVAMPARAQTTAVTPEELDSSIKEVLERREFAWRMPREAGSPDDHRGGLIEQFLAAVRDVIFDYLRAIADFLERVWRWIEALFPSRGRVRGPGWGLGLDWATGVRLLLAVLLTLVAGTLVYFLIKIWRTRATADVQAEVVPFAPNLEEDEVSADTLPEDGWLELARELMGKGQLRLALRALFLAGLAALAGRELIRVAKHKSNREYVRELERRSHAAPDVLALFRESVGVFERVWYGAHGVSEELVRAFGQNQERLRALVQKQ